MLANESEPSICVAVTEEEKRDLYRFRYEIYVGELGKSYANADHENRQIVMPLDDIGTQLYVQHNGRVIGCMRLDWGEEEPVIDAYRKIFSLHLFSDFPGSAFVFSSRFIVAPEYRKTDVSKSLLSTAYTLGRQKGAVFSFCDCAPQLVAFYERLGFRRYADTFEDPDAGTLAPMVLIGGDIDHLTHVGSPFLSLAQKWPARPDVRGWYETHFGANESFQRTRLSTA